MRYRFLCLQLVVLGLTQQGCLGGQTGDTTGNNEPYASPGASVGGSTGSSDTSGSGLDPGGGMAGPSDEPPLGNPVTPGAAGTNSGGAGGVPGSVNLPGSAAAGGSAGAGGNGMNQGGTGGSAGTAADVDGGLDPAVATGLIGQDSRCEHGLSASDSGADGGPGDEGYDEDSGCP